MRPLPQRSGPPGQPPEATPWSPGPELARVRLAPGQRHPGPGPGWLLVAEGEVELWGADPETGAEHPVAVRGPGALVVEPGPLQARSAAVLVVLPAEPPPAFWLQAGPVLQRQAAAAAAARAADAQHRVAAGHFLVALLALLCAYTLTLGLLPHLGSPSSTAWVSMPLQVLFVLGTARFLRRSRLPLREFGLTLEGAARAAPGALALSGALLGGVLLAKWAWLATLPEVGRPPLLGLGGLLAEPGPGVVAGYAAAYLGSVTMQELVLRPLQSGLERFLHGPGRAHLANLLTSAVFAITHLHLSPAVAAGSFAVGLAWGELFRRQRTLAGAAASHALVGLVSFFVIGVGSR